MISGVARHHFSAGLALLVAGAAAACAGTVVRPAVSAPKPAAEALLILPGFGYGRSAEAVFQSLAASTAAEGIDLFVPTYISRAGLANSRANLQHFIRDHRLAQYERLHVFAFIAGAWTINPVVAAGGLPNLATIIYDRSPYQERAPRIADEHVHFLTWIRYGSPVFDVARTAYVPLVAPAVKVGIVVETRPTSFVKKHEQTARSYGPFDFSCDAFTQRYDDCVYLPMAHEQVYGQFREVWPQLLAFIRGGRFTNAAERRPPTGDPLAEAKR